MRIDDHAGLWTWPFLLAAVAVIGFVRNRIFAFRVATPDGPAPKQPERHFRVYDEASWPRQPVGRLRFSRLPILPRPAKWFKSR